jgi:hypothetical protein
MNFVRTLIAIGLVVAVATFSSPARAGVIVLTNHTADRILFTLIRPDGQETRHGLDREEVMPVPVDTTVAIVFGVGPQPQRYVLRANGIYYFHVDGNKLDLLQHPLPGLSADQPAPPLRPSVGNSLCTIPVKVLVDDKEPAVPSVWEKRYRERIAAASAIIEPYCHVRFQVVAVGTWTSDNNAHELEQLIEEFEQKVKPTPARLAIGFTAQYETLHDEKHLGGTRGPFRSHILIREWGRQITESERLEILVHELGHFLGAVHSPEHQSVMRPNLGDRQSRARDFRIGFDAPNTMIMYLVGEEFCRRPLVHLCQFPSAAKDQLRGLYSSLATALPSDPAAPRYLAMLDQSLGLAAESPEHLRAVIAGARGVVQAVTEAARKNQDFPKAADAPAGGQTRWEGDRLTEFYVRQAAAAAARLPGDVAAEAFLLGLGVALDDSSLLRNAPVVGSLWQQIEPASERTARLAALGVPTMHARHDLAQHFAASAALAVLVGPQGAEGAGILKELADSRGGSGFSFVDLSADLAGIVFAGAVGSGKIDLSRLEEGFAIDDFLPNAGELKEGIGWDDFVKAYGYPPDARLTQERESLRKRILALSGYK